MSNGMEWATGWAEWGGDVMGKRCMRAGKGLVSGNK